MRAGGIVPRAGFPPRAERAHDAAVRVELEHDLGGDVGDPEVAARVERDAVRALEQARAERAHERAARVELEQGLRAAIQDVEVAARVERGRCELIDLDADGPRYRVLLRDDANAELRARDRLRRDRRALRERGRSEQAACEC